MLDIENKALNRKNRFNQERVLVFFVPSLYLRLGLVEYLQIKPIAHVYYLS